MVEPSGSKALLVSGGRDVSTPSPAHTPVKRQAPAQKQRGAPYCAHAPEPFAAMASRGDWSTELWDIFAHPGGANMCCLSLWCPCIQYGLLLEQLPPGSVTCAGSVAGGCAVFCVLWLLGDLLGAALLTKVFSLPCTALVHAQTRGYIRRKYGIQSHPIHDFFITWCCAPCALCQEARETVIRQAAEREDSSSRPSRSSSVHNADAWNGAGPVPPISSPNGSANAGAMATVASPTAAAAPASLQGALAANTATIAFEAAPAGPAASPAGRLATPVAVVAASTASAGDQQPQPHQQEVVGNSPGGPLAAALERHHRRAASASPQRTARQ